MLHAKDKYIATRYLLEVDYFNQFEMKPHSSITTSDVTKTTLT